MSCGSHPLHIFREYVTHQNDFPTGNINPNTQNFDFILGFASETNGNGQFVPNWNVDALNAQRVRELKGKHSNVRVVISIGGVGSEFNPLPNINWVATAVSSISAIILQKYQNLIDGIDIHYDVIKSSGADFARYIGDLIQQLKGKLPIIKVVSIAPTEKVQDYYLQLYAENRKNIDWVDYRFYDQKFSSVPEFIKCYNEVVAAYDAAGKVLAGISINPQDLIIFGGIIALIENNGMPGVFVWNADKSLQNLLQNL